MPVITIESSQLTVEKKREAAAVITAEFSRISGIPEQAITVLFHELPRESIATAGKLLSDRDRFQRHRMDGWSGCRP